MDFGNLENLFFRLVINFLFFVGICDIFFILILKMNFRSVIVFGDSLFGLGGNINELLLFILWGVLNM